MKRFFSLVLAVMLFCTCLVGNASAVDTRRASLTLNLYQVFLLKGSSDGEVCIDFCVQSNMRADSLGVESIKLYKSNGSYVTTIYGSTSNGLIEENSSIHQGTYEYELDSGSYYAKVTVFAEDGSEYDSKTVTTSTVRV